MKRTTLAALVLATFFVPLGTQGEYKFFSPPGAFAVEVSLENSSLLRLPMYRNAIVSLEITGKYAVGGTAAAPGLSPFLFAVSLPERRMESVLDLGAVAPGQREIRSGFARGGAGILYAGTTPDKGAGGHLIEVRLTDGRITAIDLGIPVPAEGIFALASDTSAKRLYGITHPSGRFFTCDFLGRDVRLFSDTALSTRTLAALHDYAVGPDDVLCRRLAVDRSGRVFGSAPINRLFRFDPGTGKITFLADELPEVWGRRPLGRVEAWALAPDGQLYGGCAGDGQLFRVDPATDKVTNLGKPAMMPGMPGLAFGADGRLYGVAGVPPGYAHLFAYDPRRGGYTDLGNPRFPMTEPGIEQGIWWRGFRIATVAASEDGRFIVLGEEEALSQLMAFPVP
jgi:hypothetical protein